MRAGKSGRCRQLGVHSCFTGDQTKRHLYGYRCTLLCRILSGSFKETAPRKTAENTAKHRGGGVGSVVANHRGGGESSIIRNNTNYNAGGDADDNEKNNQQNVVSFSLSSVISELTIHELTGPRATQSASCPVREVRWQFASWRIRCPATSRSQHQMIVVHAAAAVGFVRVELVR